MSGQPHEDVLAAVAVSDLVVDQLNSETPGVLSAEAMALGKPVICEYDERKARVVRASVPGGHRHAGDAARPGCWSWRPTPSAAASWPRPAATTRPGCTARAPPPPRPRRVYEHAPRAAPGIYEAGPGGLRSL